MTKNVLYLDEESDPTIWQFLNRDGIYLAKCSGFGSAKKTIDKLESIDLVIAEIISDEIPLDILDYLPSNKIEKLLILSKYLFNNQLLSNKEVQGRHDNIVNITRNQQIQSIYTNFRNLDKYYLSTNASSDNKIKALTTLLGISPNQQPHKRSHHSNKRGFRRY